ELGRYLFFDRRLSFNQTKSCAGCHAPQFAFTDGYRRSFGATADMHQRNTQPLFNILFLERLTSANPSLIAPEQQMAIPLFNTKVIEMGLKGHETEVLNRFSKDARYRELFARAFPGREDAISVIHVISAIAAFSKTIISANSRYDDYAYRNKKNALSASELRGMQLFYSDSLGCGGCHSGFNFSGGTGPASVPFPERLYFNTGLYNVDGKGAYPAYDEGLKEFSGNAADMGKIRVPTLRNLAFTGPYMHDGSVASLPEVIDIYARGGRLIDRGEHQGDGRTSPNKSARINGFHITPQQKSDLLNFLFSLTDSALLTRPQYQNPFAEDETGR
ncbi:MAG: di-heme enzyme, partial [Dinghuibacter sp.]|nr:di-heme enzyme [Dinghuibacter sp.]